MQAIEGELKSSLDQFQGYERQDLKYQEDVKHLKQKLKKLEEKIAKVIVLPTSTLVCVAKNLAIQVSFSYLTSISVWTCVVLSH
jgi:aspartate/glutamate racemase